MSIKTSAETFREDIEVMVAKGKLSYLEAILEWCNKKNVDPEYVASMITSNAVLKGKLQIEAENLNFIPKSIKQLI